MKEGKRLSEEGMAGLRGKRRLCLAGFLVWQGSCLCVMAGLWQST